MALTQNTPNTEASRVLESSDISKILLATLAYRFVSVIVVILTLSIRPTLPPLMLAWFARVSYPLLAYSLLLLIFYRKTANLLQKHSFPLLVDLLISIGVIMIGGSWRSSYFGYTLTTIILFTIFRGKKGAYFSTIIFSAVSLIKDPTGGLPSLKVFYIDDFDMRMGAALIYITSGLILGYFSSLLRRLEMVSAAKLEETQKLAVMAEKTRMALELHDGVKQMVTAMLFMLNPLAKQQSTLAPETSGKIQWLWRGMNYLQSELNQVMDALKADGNTAESIVNITAIAEEEAAIVGVMTGFSWDIRSEPPKVYLRLVNKLALRRLLGEAIMNAGKHSGAKSGVIILQESNKEAVITVSDHGRGFVYRDNGTTTGMKSMLHRVAELNGRLAVESAPGKGCRIEITLPVQRDGKELPGNP